MEYIRVSNTFESEDKYIHGEDINVYKQNKKQFKPFIDMMWTYERLPNEHTPIVNPFQCF